MATTIPIRYNGRLLTRRPPPVRVWPGETDGGIVWLIALFLECPGPGRGNDAIFDQIGTGQHGAPDDHRDAGKGLPNG
jgi:hypothetical protein